MALHYLVKQSVHHTRVTIELLKKETPKFISP